MSGVALFIQAPIPPHPDDVAFNMTLVVDNAFERIAAEVVSIVIDCGSVVQLPIFPCGAVVSTTKLCP